MAGITFKPRYSTSYRYCIVSFARIFASFSVFCGLCQQPGWGREIFAFFGYSGADGGDIALAGAYADKHGSTRVLAFGAIFAALGFGLRGVLFDETMFVLTDLVGIGTGAHFQLLLWHLVKL